MSLEYDENNENAQSNLPGWQKKITAGNEPQRTGASPSQSTVDPLASYQGQPILGQRGPNKHYVGRVVVELWETGQPVDDSHQIVFTADATDGNHGALLRRIAPALLKRVQKGPTF
jgi:hypothetical protein